MAWKKLAFYTDIPVLSDTAPADADHAVAAAGAASEAARRDHKHDLTEGDAGTIKAVDGTAAALGSDNAVPHLDHVHELGPLVADLDFDLHQAPDFIAERRADWPAHVGSEGQVIYYTNDDHLYIYTVA